MKNQKNEPAFACRIVSRDQYKQTGLTKREYHASAAMAMLIGSSNNSGSIIELSVLAVDCADALMKALEEGDEK